MLNYRIRNLCRQGSHSGHCELPRSSAPAQVSIVEGSYQKQHRQRGEVGPFVLAGSGTSMVPRLPPAASPGGERTAAIRQGIASIYCNSWAIRRTNDPPCLGSADFCNKTTKFRNKLQVSYIFCIIVVEKKQSVRLFWHEILVVRLKKIKFTCHCQLSSKNKKKWCDERAA
jgi:hypothetical protein